MDTTGCSKASRPALAEDGKHQSHDRGVYRLEGDSASVTILRVMDRRSEKGWLHGTPLTEPAPFLPRWLLLTSPEAASNTPRQLLGPLFRTRATFRAGTSHPASPDRGPATRPRQPTCSLWELGASAVNSGRSECHGPQYATTRKPPLDNACSYLAVRSFGIPMLVSAAASTPSEPPAGAPSSAPTIPRTSGPIATSGPMLGMLKKTVPDSIPQNVPNEPPSPQNLVRSPEV
jgi:hypothetical protein